MATTAMLDAVGVTKTYDGRRVLDGLDLQVEPGEIAGLLGPNGAGKTTFVSIVTGLVRPDAGSVRVGDGDVVADPRRARRLLGLAPQETGVYPTLTCRENLRFFGALAGLGRRALSESIERTSNALGLDGLLDRRAGLMSGGERRRLHTALALLHRPPLVLLDEPTTGADVETRTQLLELVADVAASGSAVVYSTHYLAEIEQLAASVVILDRGQVVVRGSVPELIAAHGASVVEVRLGVDPPPLHAPPDSTLELDGTTIRLRAQDPGVATARLLGELGGAVGSVESLEVMRPSLESVFLEQTGRRYGGPGERRDVA